MDEKLIAKAEKLERKAKRLREKAFDTRVLPEHWEIGQIVELLVDKEFFAPRGTLLRITDVTFDCKLTPAKDYCVFWTRRVDDTAEGHYWTVSSDVELYALA